MANINTELNTLQHILEDIQAQNLVIIDVKAQTAITDYMIICSGRSARHVRSIAEQAAERMKKANKPALSITGLENGEWVLIDFGDYIVHVLQPDMRDFYNLEGLWQPLNPPCSE